MFHDYPHERTPREDRVVILPWKKYHKMVSLIEQIREVDIDLLIAALHRPPKHVADALQELRHRYYDYLRGAAHE